jgi:hypothetical protein
MVQPTLEYASAAWDPYTCDQINQLDKVQRRAARFVSNNYRDKTPGCVTAMVKSLGWEPLQERRKSHRLIVMYKIKHGLVCIPESSYMVQTSDSRTRGANRLIQHHTNIAAYKQSFFPRTIQEWNRLPIAVTNTTKLEEFKASLLSEMALQQTA